MKRFAMIQLERWKEKESRKPLIIRGARQVGKTWLMKEFGRLHYQNTVYINFENNKAMQSLFQSAVTPEDLVAGLEIYAGHKIEPGTTLLIFDEIQESPGALTALKYFNEEMPQYQIVCAGSLLGVALHPGTSFPVGKVEFMDLRPLSFFEFLDAIGRGQYVSALQEGSYSVASSFRQEYELRLKQYYYVGGMPEAVFAFARNSDYHEVRDIQERILSAYEQDFSKHAPHDIVPRIRMVWNSVPAQLARENKKYVYGMLREGARAKDYELALLWLSDCGLVHKVHRVSAPKTPPGAYEDLKAFKLYLLDVGLLSCMSGLSQQVLLEGNRLFSEFKGALTEQYVLQQLKALGTYKTYYWTPERAIAEVDFVVADGDEIIPIEVKAELNLQSKSLKVYREKFSPRISVRTSMAEYKKEEGLISLPLWGIETISQVLDSPPPAPAG